MKKIFIFLLLLTLTIIIFSPVIFAQTENEAYTWHLDTVNAYEGNHSASCRHDPNETIQDEWLISPIINLTGYIDISFSFHWFMSYFWSVDPYDNYDLNVYYKSENESNWQLVWNEESLEPFENWVWYNSTDNKKIDLSSYREGNLARLGFQYSGCDGAQLNIDAIRVYGKQLTNPPVVDAGAPYEGYVSETINFHSNVTGGESPYTWFWDFGDNTHASKSHPIHAYNSIGNYSITVKVTDGNGISDSDSTTVTIRNMSKVPELVIDDISGIIGIHALIVNKGCIDATNIEWTILMMGGLGNNVDVIDKGNILCLEQKCCQEIQSKIITGFGLLDVTVLVKADNMNRISKQCKAIILGQIILPIKD